ncbi:hypothetical protein GCM10009737_28240 [Nocardioides lentus]|uniref:Uncharacterized protein n=1 Tax=Nocardioides lentus TaxID=338077 RepID=A0ABN2PPX9_9ACTN
MTVPFPAALYARRKRVRVPSWLRNVPPEVLHAPGEKPDDVLAAHLDRAGLPWPDAETLEAARLDLLNRELFYVGGLS